MAKKINLKFTVEQTLALLRALDFGTRYEESFIDATSGCKTIADELLRRATKENIREFKSLTEEIRGVFETQYRPSASQATSEGEVK